MKVVYKSFLFFILIFQIQIVSAQQPTEQDCLGAIPVYDYHYSQPNSYVGSGNYPNEIPTTGGCPGNCMLSGELNCVWYVISFISDGDFGFRLSPNNPSDDYDWVVYDLSNNSCGDIFTMVDSLQVSCNWSGTANSTGPTGHSTITCGSAGSGPYCNLIPVHAGENYVINISNYSSTQYGYTLDLSMTTAAIGTTTGISGNLSKDGIDIVPNPNTGEFSVTFPQKFLNQDNGSMIRITDINGKVIDEHTINSCNTDRMDGYIFKVSGKGIYFLEYISQDDHFVEKVIVY